MAISLPAHGIPRSNCTLIALSHESSLPSRDPIDDPAAFDVLDLRVETVLAFAPVAVLLQPLAQQRHQVPLARVDSLGERRDGFGTRRQRVEGVAEDVMEQTYLLSLGGSQTGWVDWICFTSRRQIDCCQRPTDTWFARYRNCPHRGCVRRLSFLPVCNLCRPSRIAPRKTQFLFGNVSIGIAFRNLQCLSTVLVK